MTTLFKKGLVFAVIVLFIGAGVLPQIVPNITTIVKAYPGDVIDSFDSPGGYPKGLTWDGSHLWNEDWFDLTIYKLDPSDGSIVDSFDSPGNVPNGLTWDGSYLFSSQDGSIDTIYKLDPSDGSIVDSFDSPGNGPSGLAWDGSYLWNADDVSDKIYKLDPSDGSIVDSFDSPGGDPTGLTWDGSYLWNADYLEDYTIYKLDPSDGSIVDSFDSPGNGPLGLAWDGSFLWNADCNTDKIYKIDVSSPNTVYVDDNYGSSTPGWGYDHFDVIQDGVDAVAEGGSVYVFNGTYYENVVVDKTIDLIGEHRNNTLIDGSIDILSENVSIRSFTVFDSDPNDCDDRRVIINSADYSSFVHNHFVDCYLYMLHSQNCFISENIIENTSYAIWLRSSSFNNVTNNTMINCRNGLYIQNDISYDGWKNTFKDNIMIGCGMGIHGNQLHHFIQFIDTSNTVDGKPVYYYDYEYGITVPSNAGDVILVSCDSFIIDSVSCRSITLAFSSGTTIINNTGVLDLVSSHDNLITHNCFSSMALCNSDQNNLNNNTCNSIYWEDCDSNMFNDNQVLGSDQNGVCLYNCKYNTLSGNSITNKYGITLGSRTAYNEISGNYITDCNTGIRAHNSSSTPAHDNILYHNQFSDNSVHAIDESMNVWYNYSLQEGNYWDDYTGTDSDGDGIGDIPYDIPGGSNQDRFPLGLFHPIADANGPYTGTTDDSVHFDGSGSNDPDGTIVSYDWNFGDGHTGTGVKPSHKYSSSGTYDITLTVTDDDGLTDTNGTTAVIGHGNPPSIQLIYPTGGEILKDTVTIRWYAIDSEDSSNLPIYLFYSDDNFETWYQINDVLDNTGEYDWDTTSLPDGTYELLIEAVDSDNNIGHDGSEPFQIKNHDEPPENEPPEKPSKPSGPTSGKAGTSYSYSSSTTDPDGDQVWYKWDWGDETSGWLGPYDSGDTVTASHIWNEKGDYNIRVKAKDVHGEESPWSDPLAISMPKRKVSLVDTTPPTVWITKPENALYINDEEIMPLFIPLIFGHIQIWPNAHDNESGLKYLELYINDELKANFTSVPRSWTWDETVFGRRTIKLVAYDNAGNDNIAMITVWKFF